MRPYTFSLLLALASACSAATEPARPVAKLAELRVTTITAEPTSSLSHAEALALAQQAAACLADAYAVNISPDYFGNMSPAIPANAVLIVETIKSSQAHVGDILLCKIGDATRARRLMRKDSGPTADESLYVVGFEQDQEQVALHGDQIIARVVGHFIFDPRAKDAGRVDRPTP